MFELKNAISLNMLLWSMRQFRLLQGKADELLKSHSKKERLNRYMTFLTVVGKIIASAFVFLIGIGVELFFIRKYHPEVDINQVFCKVFIFVYLIMPAFCKSVVTKASEQRYIAIKELHMNPKSYILVQYAAAHMWKFIGELVVFLVAKSYFGLTVPILPLLVAKELFSAAVEALYLREFRKSAHSTANRASIVDAIQFGLFFGGYAIAYFTQSITVNNAVMIVIAVLASGLGIYGIVYLLRYNEYEKVVIKIDSYANMKSRQIEDDGTVREQSLKNVSGNGVDLSYKYGELSSPEESFFFLQYVFFERHKRIKNKVKNANLISGILVALAAIAAKILGYTVTQEMINQYCPWLILWCMMIPYGLQYVRAMFYNADSSLLKYDFYRTSHAVIVHYGCRAAYLFFDCLLQTITMSLGVIVAGIIMKVSFGTILAIIATILLLKLLFLLSELAIYYLLQPYKIEVKNKRLSYSIFEYAKLSVLYAAINLTVTVPQLLLISLGALVLIVGAMSILVYKIGSKTFRIRS